MPNSLICFLRYAQPSKNAIFISVVALNTSTAARFYSSKQQPRNIEYAPSNINKNARSKTWPVKKYEGRLSTSPSYPIRRSRKAELPPTNELIHAFREELRIGNLNSLWPLYSQIRESEPTMKDFTDRDMYQFVKVLFSRMRFDVHHKSKLELNQGTERDRNPAYNVYLMKLQELISDFKKGTLFSNGGIVLYLLCCLKEIGAYRDAKDFWDWIILTDPQMTSCKSSYGPMLQIYADSPLDDPTGFDATEVSAPVLSEDEIRRRKLLICRELWYEYLERSDGDLRGFVPIAMIYSCSLLGDLSLARQIWSQWDSINGQDKSRASRAVSYFVWNRYDFPVAAEFFKLAIDRKLVLVLGSVDIFIRHAMAARMDMMQIFDMINNYYNAVDWPINTYATALVVFIKEFFKRHRRLTADSVVQFEIILQNLYSIPNLPTPVFNTILHSSVRYWNDETVFTKILDGALVSGLKPSVVTYRILVSAQAHFHNRKAVYDVWSLLVKAQKELANDPKSWERNLICLRESTRIIKDPVFFYQQLSEYADFLPADSVLDPNNPNVGEIAEYDQLNSDMESRDHRP
ncbi:uncharacterized protein V1516DRAFT_675900 [Lipomyces oligophaga]|uniref:uncharacterized protein n=1 Tax=Lipomyces oligophaga TaxID=45792 RepID=UPI0034CFF05E